MAALTITEGNIVPVTTGTNYNVTYGIAAVTITKGQSVYKLSDGTVGLADANAATPAYIPKGISITSAAAGQPVYYQFGGDLGFGAILTVAETYIIGATAGAIYPVGDLASGWYLGYLGYATTTSNMTLNVLSTGYAKA